eukprot:1147255-Pelagomonas_calceolata.AAC.7
MQNEQDAGDPLQVARRAGCRRPTSHGRVDCTAQASIDCCFPPAYAFCTGQAGCRRPTGSMLAKSRTLQMHCAGSMLPKSRIPQCFLYSSFEQT